MNFIELKSSNGSAVLINLSLVTCITQDPDGMATVWFSVEDYIDLNERYDDLVSTIGTIQRRMSK